MGMCMAVAWHAMVSFTIWFVCCFKIKLFRQFSDIRRGAITNHRTQQHQIECACTVPWEVTKHSLDLAVIDNLMACATQGDACHTKLLRNVEWHVKYVSTQTSCRLLCESNFWENWTFEMCRDSIWTRSVVLNERIEWIIYLIRFPWRPLTTDAMPDQVQHFHQFLANPTNQFDLKTTTSDLHWIRKRHRQRCASKRP